MSNWRDSSLIVPGSQFLGPNVTDTFCTLSASGAGILSWADQNQTGLLVGLLLVVLGIVALAFQTRRRVGQAAGL
jgi:hypothetical protein